MLNITSYQGNANQNHNDGQPGWLSGLALPSAQGLITSDVEHFLRF